MMSAGPWLTAAAMPALPGLPSSERRRRDWLARHGVPSRQASGQRGGGGLEWDCSALPPDMTAALALFLAAQAPAMPAAAHAQELPAPAAAATTGLALARRAEIARDEDKRCADARVLLLQHLRDLSDAGFGVTKACAVLSDRLANNTAPADVMSAARAANARARTTDGPGVLISARSLMRWHTEHAANGWQSLVPQAPQAKPLAAVADDVARVLKRYGSTAGASRNLTTCAQAITTELGRPFDHWLSLYHRARRALPKVEKVSLVKARHTGAARDARLTFKRRLTHNIAPHDVWVCDGHSFKAPVRHPDHGHPFTPEVTVCLDVASRYITGWSAALSESVIAVGDAVRNAVGHVGIPPAMLYSDNGGGQTGKQLDCAVAGIYARLGISHPKGLPGKPQGHGIIERSWQTHMIRAARRMGGYRGHDADPGAVREVRLAMAREATAVKRAAAEADGTVVKLSAKVPGWAEFLREVAQAVWEYNHQHRHRGLPKHTEGPHAGLHMTPAEALASMAEPADARLRVDMASVRDLMMPALLRTPVRGWVRLLNQWYHHDDLVAHGVDGVQCRVHYDIHDASRVWVYTTDGRFVAECQHEGNSMDFMPLPAIDLARYKRVNAAIKRLDEKRDRALAELSPTLQALTNAPSPELPPMDLPMVERVAPAAQPAPAIEAAPDARPPFFESAAARYEWLMCHRQAWGDVDAQWLATYADSPEYSGLRHYFETRGIGWPREGDEAPSFSQAG